MPTRRPLLGNLIFAAFGPGLEAGVAPLVLTQGWQRGEGWLDALPITIVGAVLAAAGLVALVACFVGFVGSGGGTPSPIAPAGTLMATGIYRYSRNPMYLATATLIAAQGLILARPILLAGGAVYLSAMAALVTLREERVLAHRFGPAWDEHCGRVRRWL